VAEAKSEDGAELVSAHIVSSVLSKVSSEHIWVACSDGRIWYINWVSGAGADTPFVINTKKVLDATVESVDLGSSAEDVLLVLQKLSKTSAQIVAYNTKALSSSTGKLLHTYDESPRLLRSAVGARVIVAAAKESVHIGLLKAKKKALSSLDDLEYRFHSFGVSDIITCLDIRPTLQTTKKGGVEIQALDLVVGSARGAIYVYNDVLSKLPGGEPGSLKAAAIHPRKFHWHRRAVHSVKWSEDGKESPRHRSFLTRLTSDQATISSQVATKRSWYSGSWILASKTTCLIWQRLLRTLLFRLAGRRMPFTLTTILPW